MVGWLGVVADMGSALARDTLDQGISSLKKKSVERLSLVDHSYLLLAQGFRSHGCDDFERAVAYFGRIRTRMVAGELTGHLGLCAYASFGWAKSLRDQGQYQRAKQLSLEAEQLARKAGFGPFVLVCKGLRAWITFKTNGIKEARSLFSEVLRDFPTSRDPEDLLTFGRIEASLGRTYHEQGDFEEALLRYTKTLAYYSEAEAKYGISSTHRSRVLVQMAGARRLLALNLEDAKEAQEIRTDALDDCETAKSHTASARIRGRADLMLGWLYLDRAVQERFTLAGREEQFTLAVEAANSAEGAVEKTADAVLFSRLKVLQADIEIEKSKVDHRALDQAIHLAELAEQAAAKTGDRYLNAEAQLSLGFALAVDRDESSRAWACYNKAEELLGTTTKLIGYSGYIQQKLRSLRAILDETDPIPPWLRGFARGDIGTKKLKDILREAEDYLLLKLWRDQVEVQKCTPNKLVTDLGIGWDRLKRSLARSGIDMTEAKDPCSE